MIPQRFAKWLFPLLIGMLFGCVPPQQQQRVELDLAEMKRRLAQNEQALVGLRKELSGGGGNQVTSLARGQADLKADFDSLRADLMSLQGRLDELGASRNDQSGQLTQLRDELAFKVKALEERLAKLEAEPRTSLAVPVTPPAAAPETLYQKGLDAIRNDENFSEGRKLLGEFLDKNPQHPLAVNAKYWIGEAWYGEKKYENAILQFQDVIQEFGDHPKVAAALLKQGLAFQALGDKSNARVILQKVVERFPLSSEASRAKDLLKQP